MARDAALLEQMHDCSSPAVRVYSWAEPAVTIGRLQHEDEVRALYPHLPIVRRPTGGRAVLHGNDLTVSIATRAEWLPGDCESVIASYRAMVAGVVSALCRAGIPATIGRAEAGAAIGYPNLTETGGDRLARIRAVDCFARVAQCDVSDASNGRKLVGSAQRRDRGAILQQMSITRDTLELIGASAGEGQLVFLRILRDEMATALGVDTWAFVET